MKLIKMTDFVLENKADMTPNNDVFTVLNRLNTYANFLNTELSLGMFIACDLDGNVLVNPICQSASCNNESQNFCDCFDYDEDEYQEAQQRVLFEGNFKEHKNSYNTQVTWTGKNNNIYQILTESMTIEDLIPYDLTLTESAKQQIFGIEKITTK